MAVLKTSSPLPGLGGEGAEGAQGINEQHARGSLPAERLRQAAQPRLRGRTGTGQDRELPLRHGCGLQQIPGPAAGECRALLPANSGRGEAAHTWWPASRPCLAPGVLAEGCRWNPAIHFEAHKRIQPMCTAAPAGSRVKNAGSSCRGRRNVVPFVFAQHRAVVGWFSVFRSRNTGGSSVLLVAQCILSLSPAPWGRGKKGCW